MSLRDLNQMSIETATSEISQKRFRRDYLCEKSLRRLKNISEKCLFRDVSEIYQIISRKYLCFSKISHENDFL